MRIAYYYNEEWEKEFISSQFPEDTFNFFKGPSSSNPDAEDTEAEVLSVFVNTKVDANLLDKFPKAKLVATRGTGFDHVDVAEVARRGGVTVNVPAYGEHTVAEFAMALLLALSRRIYNAYRRIETTGSFDQEGLRGFDLLGRTIGIVGTGHIGVHMITMAKAFGMDVIAFDVHQDETLASSLGFRYVSFDELLSSSDVISLHAPYNLHTHHMINQENVGRIKRGAYLINTARGGLVETAALVSGLRDGIIGGAGLDVLEEEGHMEDEAGLLSMSHPNEDVLRTLLANHYFIHHPHVIVTAHIAFNTQEAIERILNTTIENIHAFKNGSPINVVIPK